MFEENVRCKEFLHTESGAVEHQFYLMGHELLGMLQHGRFVLTPEIRSLIRSDPAEALQQRVPGNNIRRGENQGSIWFQNAVYLRQHRHRVVQEVLEDLRADDDIECIVRVGIYALLEV